MVKKSIFKLEVASILIITFIISIVLDFYLQDKHLEEINSKLTHYGNFISSDIKKNISQAITKTTTLEYLLKSNKYESKDFETWVKYIHNEDDIINCLQLAKNGVISHIYPMQDHKNAIGFDILKNKRQNKKALFTIDSQKITFTNPITLVQNNKIAVIARKPIFKNQNDKNSFWGFSSALIYIDDIVHTYLDFAKENNMNIQVIGNNKEKEIFNQNIEFDKKHHQIFDIMVPNGKWKLIVSSNEELKTNYFIYIVNMLVALLISFILYQNFLQRVALSNQNEELKKAKQKAEDATQAKSLFLANTSHEIRTPINGIIGLIHLTLQTKLNQKQKEYISNIDKSAKLLLHIINDILDFSKIEAKKLSIEKREFDIFTVIDNIVHIIEHKVEEKNLKLEINYKQELGYMFYGDDFRLSQILTNLLSNAIKFTIDGKVELNISKIKDNRYRFEVKDTGIGLSPEQRDNLFKSFSQADSSTTRKFGGTGLGLCISKELIELMNGKIWCESQIDVGSSFIFEIELEKIEDKNFCTLIHNHITEDEKLKILTNKINNIKNMNILLAEDNSINQQILIGLLENSSINIDIANNGEEAIEKYNQNKNKYNLILMDIQMPIIDGYKASKTIRKRDINIPIIAITANAMAEDIQKTKQAKMNGHIAKPIDVTKLYETILEYAPITNQVSSPQNQDVQKVENIDKKTLEYIDYENGLKQIVNNKEMYEKILTKFYNTYKDFNIYSKDKETQKRDIHTIKGLSANIGAKKLHKISKMINDNFDEKLFDSWTVTLQKTIQDIEKII
jgi:signal transduction histidine kinase/AmiR/NasT family two-component response regulator/HPt (histidine-containing phosphotransfer) domain-containing protein